LRIFRYDSIDSTNLEASRLIGAGERGPAWIVAKEQTAGKGRLGRNWVSKPGNLYSTLLWPTEAEPVAISQLSFVAALAVHDTASKFTNPVAISLKWPNDCLLDGAKFCGILAEVLAPGLVAIGIGINIAHVPQDLPYVAARLEGTNVESVFKQLALSLSHWLEIWDEGRGFEAIRLAWETRCQHIGKMVMVDGQPGTFIGLAPHGAMVLRAANGETKHVYAGDVRLEYQPTP
jgi:BirA family transcriptional regulator, biotin operon repressor / biotin---[acetyl-CoA-carboxylase] ligase